MSQVEKFLIDLVSVYRKSYAEDKFGGSETAEKLVGSEVRVRIYAKTGAIRITESGKEYRPTHRLIANYDVNIEADDKLIDQNGVKYQVLERSRRRIGTIESQTECKLQQVAG